MVNKISTVFEFDERGNGLRRIKSDVQATEGSFNKMKTAGKGAMTTLKQYGPEAALVVGGAVATAAYKAGQEFADAAVEVGRFSDATGLTTEQASKWVSVADDLQLNSEDFLKVFQRLNKEIGEGDGVVEEYGISLARTADGMPDVNQTMLNAIDVVGGIVDPTERARVAQELFGRSYANVAEVIFDSAANVQRQLESTSDAQIFDEDEVQKGRDYRAAMDQLNDVMTDLKMTVGEGVVPQLSNMAGLLVDINDIGKQLGGNGLFGDLFEVVNAANPTKWLVDYNKAALDFLGISGDANGELIRSEELWNNFEDAERQASIAILNGVEDVDLQSESLRDNAKAANHAADMTLDKAAADEHAAEMAERHRAAVAALFDEVNNNLSTMFDYEEASIAVEDAVKGFADAAVAALEAANDEESSLADREQALRDMRSAELDAADAALDAAGKYAESQGAIQGTTEFAMLQREELSRLADKFPELSDEIAQFIAELDRIPAVKTVSLIVNRSNTNASLAAVGATARVDEFGNLKARANGGPVAAGSTYLVGERGPELLTMGANGYVTPNNKIGGGISIGSIVVQAPAGADADAFGRSVREAIRREIRFNGPVAGWAA